MSRDVLVSLNNRAFILAALRGVDSGGGGGGGPRLQLRLDGRSPGDRRTLSIKAGVRATAASAAVAGKGPAGVGRGGDNSGFVEVALGQTRVLASVTGEVVAPNPNRPAEGFLNFFASLSPLSSPAASSSFSLSSSSHPSERSIELVRLLERSIRDSRTVDVESLCLISGSHVWSLRVDLLIIDDCGNLTDAASIAALSALLRYRRPDATVTPGSVIALHSMDERQPIALHLHRLPLCTTFALFDGGQLWVVDPTLEEEAVSEGCVSVAIDDFHDVCGVYKMGGAPVAVERLMQLIAMADARTQEVVDKVRGGEEGKEGGRGARTQQRGEEVKRKAVGSGVEGADLFGVGIKRSVGAMESEEEVREKRMDTIDLGQDDARPHQPHGEEEEKEEADSKMAVEAVDEVMGEVGSGKGRQR